MHRYELRRVLGRGGTGTVYEALDTKTQAVVALKTVSATVAEDLYRLKHEFRVLTDVQHQNLVHFGELACEDNTWFFTMELVSGVNFIDYVRPAAVAGESLPTPSDVVDDSIVTRTVLRELTAATGIRIENDRRGGPTYVESRLRRALVQLIEAVSVVHAAGHVHRDVKPSNVLVSREGRVVLIDFGLVLALAGGEASSGDRMGTPSYMAPEQIEGLPLGPAADWYAVGTMLYVALTGVLPFAHCGDVLRAKLDLSAPEPRDLVRGLPPDLERLCVDLLDRDPRKRPSEDDIRARLRMPPRARASTAPPAPSEAVALFVGRLREQDQLTSALRDVERGQPRVVVVEGEPGVGKTALVHQFLAENQDRPLTLSGRCYEQEIVPFQGIDSIIDALSEHLLTRSSQDVSKLVAGGVRYLATVFPVLRRVPAIQAAMSPARMVASQSGLREHAFDECARLFAALAAERPLIVCLDDLQWVDADSLALLERSVLPQSGASCLFLATLRSGVDLAPAVATLRAAAARIELAGLPEEASRALWDTLRHADDSSDSDHATERAIAMREAAGHPLFLAELARAAREGRFDRHAGALLDVLRDRIGQHDQIERDFLEMAAIAGAPMPYQIIARAAGLDVGECHARIGRLKVAQLLRVSLVGDDRCVEPYHDRVREAVMERLREDPARPVELRLRLGRALLDAAPDSALRGRIFIIVQHLNAARALLSDPEERRRHAELNLLASREARLATAYDRARAYAGIGLELLGETGRDSAFEVYRDLQVARIEAEHLAGDHTVARSVFDEVRPHLLSASDIAALWGAWITLETGKSRFREAVEAGREALRELGMPIPEPITWATVRRQYAATRRAQRGRPLTALEALPPLTDPTLTAALQLLMAIGPVAFFVDTNLLAWVNMRIAEVSMRHGLSEVTPFGFAGYGMVLAGMFGEREEGAAFGELSLRLNDRLGGDHLAARLHVQNGAFIRHWVRPFADAEVLLRTAHRLGVQHGDAAYEVYAAKLLSVFTFCESLELATVQTTAEWARDVAARRRIHDMIATPDIHARYAAALRGLSSSPLDLGRPSSSDAELRAGLDDETAPIAMFYYHFCNADLAYLAGDLRRAMAQLAAAEQRTRGIFGEPMVVELCFLAALIAARRHDASSGWERLRPLARLIRHSHQLDAWARSCPDNYLAHALLVHAELMRVVGRRRQAEGAYRGAIAAARGLGATKREALALELAARHAAARRDAALAERRWREAIVAYRRWGAATKADALAASGPGASANA